MKRTGLRKALARLKLMRKTEAALDEIAKRIADHQNARCSVTPVQGVTYWVDYNDGDDTATGVDANTALLTMGEAERRSFESLPDRIDRVFVLPSRPVDIADRSTHEWEPSYYEYIVSRLGDRCGDCGDEVEIGETVWGNDYEGNVTICRACYEVR